MAPALELGTGTAVFKLSCCIPSQSCKTMISVGKHRGFSMAGPRPGTGYPVLWIRLETRTNLCLPAVVGIALSGILWNFTSKLRIFPKNFDFLAGARELGVFVWFSPFWSNFGGSNVLFFVAEKFFCSGFLNSDVVRFLFIIFLLEARQLHH